MVPIIDFRSSTVEKQMHAAYTRFGFEVFINVLIPGLVSGNDSWTLSKKCKNDLHKLKQCW